MKSTLRAKLKAANQEERLQKWKEPFHLLGNPPEIVDKSTKEIIKIQLDIKLGKFMEEVLDAVLKKIKSRKAAVLDKILPEV